MLCSLGVSGQSIHGRIIDSESKQGIPFAQLAINSSKNVILSDVKGRINIQLQDSVEVSHPFYTSKKVFIHKVDSIFIIELDKKGVVEPTKLQLSLGDSILKNHHKYLPETDATQNSSFDFLSEVKIEVLQQSKKDSEDWELLNSLESIEKNRFIYPDRKYSKVVAARSIDGDSSNLGFIPINSYSISEDNEYVKILNLNFYNPLFKGAGRRYDFSLIDLIYLEEDTIQVVHFKPKEKKHFVGFSGLLYFAGEQSESWGGHIYPNNEHMYPFTITFYKALTSKKTRFMRAQHLTLRLEDIPNYRRSSKLNIAVNNTTPDFNIKNTSSSKWVQMAFFDHKKDSVKDDTWLMTQMYDSEKLNYIKKDTLEKKFVLSNSLKIMYDIYNGKLGYRIPYFDINNVFSINKFEALRLGIGLQSHENLSDVFTFGGYVGYGFRDDAFKYGGNVGMYFGPYRTNLLSMRYQKDLLEPGLVHYMDAKQDLIKELFTSRMDEYNSIQVSLRTRINAYLTARIEGDNYSLIPQYDYVYDPMETDTISSPQTFKFTTTSLLINIGTPFSESYNLRKILFQNKPVTSNLFVNFTKGWDSSLGGEYDFWKINARLRSNFKLKELNELDIVLDGGVMKLNMPYPIMYGGPGTEFKLTGIIINDAFQTMKLYGFFTDRYAHSFLNYNFGNVIFKKSKFKPELGLALNLGWGKIKGNKAIHEDIDVRDYSNGFYEFGVLINNLLRLKMYRYFYGGLGVGAFVGYGPDAEKGSFAIRLSYELGTL